MDNRFKMAIESCKELQKSSKRMLGSFKKLDEVYKKFEIWRK